MPLLDNIDPQTKTMLGYSMLSNAIGGGGNDMFGQMMMLGMLNKNPQMQQGGAFVSAPGFYGYSMGTIPQLVNAIGQYESGNNYSSVGPVTKTGDRAYGRYQVMGNNIPSWTREVLGRQMTAQEFINNPQVQDQIAHAKLGQYYNKYGNIQDAASMWFSGRPYRGNTSRDVLGTSVPQYVRNVSAIYHRN